MKEQYKIVGVPIAAPTWAKCMTFDSCGTLWFYNGRELEYSSVVWWTVGPGIWTYGGLKLNVPKFCSNPDWWKGTKREIDASRGVVYIYVKAPRWAKWMAFDSTGELCFYSSKPKAFYFYHGCEKCERWNYSAKGRTSDLKIKVPKNVKNKDWWKGTLRRV